MAVLVLGATSPIARALAQRYASRGDAICVGARDVEEAERIAADLRVRFDVDAQARAFDARDFERHADLVAEIEEGLGAIETLVVAFGAMGDQTAAEHDFREARDIIDINYTGAASVCEAVAAHMEARGAGTIVGISSVAGDRGRASNYFYGSAKGAFTLYLQGLRNRLHARNVQVMTVKLGFVDTRMTFGMETGIPKASPDQVAGAILKAQRWGIDVFYYPPFWAGIMGIIKALPEKVFKRLSL